MTLSNYPTPKLKVHLALFLFVLLVCFISHASGQEFDSRTGLVVGLTSSNWDRQATFGYVVQHSEHLSTLSAVDVGGGQTAIQAQSLITIMLNRWTYLGLLVGPEVLIFQDTPTTEDKLTYLNVATALTLSRDVTKDFSLWAAAHYIKSSADITQYKLTIGAIIWFPN